ncbi:MAG: DUF4350 domain-containing protein [Bacteroidota bacterium]
MRKYYFFLIITIVLLVVVELLTPPPTDWSMTLHHRDKIPYGTYVLRDLIQDLFPNQQIQTSYETLYELDQNNALLPNTLVLSRDFGPDSLDTDVLFTAVANGNGAFISSNYFYGYFADTLNLDTEKEPLFGNIDSLMTDGMMIDRSVFTSYDSTRTTVLKRNGAGSPVLLQVDWGKGELYLHSDPRLFTNYELLHEQRYDEVADALSLLPVQDVLWTEYYQVGRLESSSPLRFLLSEPPLRWGLYAGLGGLLLFIVFETKRKQRAIPLYQPPANTTLEFVSTVANLYYRTRNHKKLANKKIAHFLRFVRDQYRLSPDLSNPEFREKLAHKSGKERDSIDSVLDHVIHIQPAAQVKDEELLKLNQLIDDFYQGKPQFD